MLRVIFYRVLYFFLNPIRKIYWFIVRPQTKGVKVVVFNKQQVLLVRLAYAHKLWTLPGGGVDRGETFDQAAVREVFEETGIKLQEVKKIGSYQSQKEYKNDTVEVFYGKTEMSKLEADPVEVQDIGWFELDRLPSERTKKVEELLAMVDKNFNYEK